MKNILTITSVMIFCFTGTLAQTRSNLIILDYGTISDIAEIVDPDPGLNYRMVIDLKASSTDPSKINPGLNNIARLLNLHAAGGVQAENLNVVAAIHGSARSHERAEQVPEDRR